MMQKNKNTFNVLDQGHLDKVVLAQKVGKVFLEEPDSVEGIVVSGIARGLAEDVSELVRQTLAFEVRRSPFLPKEIATIIAKDIEDVASPFLEATKVFSDQELAELVPIVEEFARVSIAKRRKITNPLTVSLIKHGGEKSVSYLVRNPGAEFEENSSKALIKKFSHSEKLLNQFSAREDLPLGVISNLAKKISQEYKNSLIKKYNISGDHASYLTDESAEVAISNMLASASPQKIQVLVNDLSLADRLTPELILNYTRRGSLDFFAASIAKIINIPFENSKRLIKEGGFSVQVKLLEKANIPPSYFKGFREAIGKTLKK